MSTGDIRKKFLNYFKNQGHSIVASSPVAPFDDPTLLFINAGMNQFKDVFLGKSRRPYTRATTSQKCIRVGGKHNDLENVGHTARHLTFFEMLGNFSFGDYFKKEAIKFAWEVTTEVFGLDPRRIWPSVYREDDEAFELWTTYVPADHIVRFGEKENFWAMGDTGPCGPCSELLYDRGPDYGSALSPYEDPDGSRYLEFWNLVFMQYNRDEGGVMQPLPRQSIDTGAGLERVMSLRMDVPSVYETDIFTGLIQQIEQVTRINYTPNRAAPFRVIADHLRSLSFAIADGVQPSNIDRGYVLRKILRRAVRYGRQLGMDKPFLARVLPRLVELMGDDYPELVTAKERIEATLTLEEESFLTTLRKGGNLLNGIVEQAQKVGNRISGDDAFKLKDTYGLPLEEILLLAKDADCSVDLDRYQTLEMEAKDRSRASAKVTSQVASESLFAELPETRFTGYQQTQGAGKVVALVSGDKRVDALSQGQEGLVVLDTTPFYAEKGGQVGDTGQLTANGLRFAVSDCQNPFTGVIAHSGKVESGTLRVGDAVQAAIDVERRQRIANNHTANHLMHWALRHVGGGAIRQAGSVVTPDRLRFDFSHPKPLSAAEIRTIEDLVNAKIRENRAVEVYDLDYADAQKRTDIIQFFGDKYGLRVRVIDIDYSKELCGGTHTDRTGNIGYFRIAKEGSISAGVRRIEAVTGAEAQALDRANEDLIADVASVLGAQPNKLLDRANKVLEEHTQYAREVRLAKQREIDLLAKTLAGQHERVGANSTVIKVVDIDPADLKALAEQLLSALKSGVVVLGAVQGDKCALVAAGTADCVQRGFSAVQIIKGVAPLIGGGGGGKADFASAGGKNPEALVKALELAKASLNG